MRTTHQANSAVLEAPTGQEIGIRRLQAVTAGRKLVRYAAAAILAIGMLAGYEATAAPKLKKSKQGKYVVENEIQFALKPEFAGTL